MSAPPASLNWRVAIHAFFELRLLGAPVIHMHDHLGFLLVIYKTVTSYTLLLKTFRKSFQVKSSSNVLHVK